ncbi:MAG: TIGR01777 family oxidoreductase [Fimbriimonadales bacterium]
MKVLMTGGTGFLGSALRRRLEQSGHSITSLSSTRGGIEGGTTFIHEGSLHELGPQDFVINLAGESVVGLWTRSKRRAIYESRVSTTRLLAEWIERSAVKPRAFLSGSAVGIYGDRGTHELTEDSDVSRTEGFLGKVCRDWEHAASPAAWRGTRTVLLRTGQVLDPGGGYLAEVLPMARRFPIVILGPRQAYFPWIALSDWVCLVIFAMENEAVSGPLNLVSPNPALQEDFTRSISLRLGKRVWGCVPRWALQLAAGEFGSSMAFSQRVLPEKALKAGYVFEYSTHDAYLSQALRSTRGTQ